MPDSGFFALARSEDLGCVCLPQYTPSHVSGMWWDLYHWIMLMLLRTHPGLCGLPSTSIQCTPGSPEEHEPPDGRLQLDGRVIQ